MSIRRFRGIIYSTRGVWLLFALVALLYLKHTAGIKVSLPLYLVSLTILVVAQGFRTWAAGFVGTIARKRAVLGEALITAGPYAYVRNPMYLGIYATVLASGLYTLNPILFLLAIFEITNEPKGFTIGR